MQISFLLILKSSYLISGGEHQDQEFKTLLVFYRILFQLFVPVLLKKTKYMRKIRRVLVVIKAVLEDSNVPSLFKVEVASTTSFLINRYIPV